MYKSILTATTASLGILLMAACNNQPKKANENTQQTDSVPTTAYIDSSSFDSTINGKPVKLYALANGPLHAAITNFGARVVSLQVPDTTGNLIDVVLGYRDLNAYTQKGDGFYGSIVGRFGNRIAKGKFSLGGKSYQLEINDGVNTLHGGTSGYYSKVWDVKSASDTTLALHYLSVDGEGGYPGNLDITATYTLHKDGLEINYLATTDQATIINVTNHAYFNLNGEGDSTILDHQLTIDADEYTPVDSTLIPTGKIASVANTPFDFRKATAIGARIQDANDQLKLGGGYDHNYVLNKKEGLRLAATVQSPKTGIILETWTDQPGLQFYSGNFIKDIKNAKGGKVYGYRSAFCLETQHFPDSPNHPGFPSTELKPGQQYRSKTIYKFRK
ncbi:aldose 1-epimerase [bacterium A37T11]|nr:aldose 1-epimerase [bacterium A37T11]